MKIPLFFIVIFSVFLEIPFKPKEEFELLLDFQFKTRPQVETVNLTAHGNTHTPLPFLSVKLNVLTIRDDEFRIRVEDPSKKVIATKMLSKGNSIKFDLGYTDDLKDQTTSQRYTIHFLGKDKILKRKIEIQFDQDGMFYVNGEKRGKI
jgi:hypothetical protein